MKNYFYKFTIFLLLTTLQIEACMRPNQGENNSSESNICSPSLISLESCSDTRIEQGCNDCDSCIEVEGDSNADILELPLPEKCNTTTEYLKQGDNLCTTKPTFPTILSDNFSIDPSNNIAIYVDENFDKTIALDTADMKILSQHFYTYLQDEYDFIFIVCNNDTLPAGVGYYGRFYPVSNAIEGLGKSIYDYSAYYGSDGKLQGMMHFPYRAGINNGPTLHELSHNWANSLINTGLSGHWNYTGFIAQTSIGGKGQLGGYDASTLINEGSGMYSAVSFGTFANGGNGLPYNDVELYLMGLISKSDVGDVYIADNPIHDKYLNSRRYFTADSIVQWDFSNLLDDLGISDRVPNHNNSQKNFRVLTVLVSDTEPTQEEIDQASDYMGQFSYQGSDSIGWYYNFYEGTGGRATLQVDGIRGTIK